MASSQIEIVAAPHVLRDHNLRIRDRERECSSKARFTFQKNIDELVRDHLNNCWGSNNNNQEKQNNNSFGLMSLSKNNENAKGESERELEENRRRQTQKLDTWAARQAREMITTIEKQTHKAELLALSSNTQSVSERASTFLRETSPSPSESSVDQNVVPNLRASSLVQMWKEFEAEATTPRANSNTHYKRLNSMKSNHENSSVGESPVGSDTDERFDNFTEWENEPTAAPTPSTEQQRPGSFQRQDSESSEGRRVADIVKRLTSGSQTTHSSLNSTSSCNDNDNVIENDPEQHALRDSSMLIDHSDQGEQRDLRLKRKRFTVRGREATKDLLLQMEQERRREVEKLAEFHAVSMFQHRGRIQSMLRLKFLQRGIVVQDPKRPASRVSELDQLHKRSSIVHLRERFGTKFQKDHNVPVLNENDLQVTAQVPTATHDSGNMPKPNEHSLQTHTQRQNVEVLIENSLETRTELLSSALDLANAQVLNTESVNMPVSVEEKLQNHTQLLDFTVDSSSVPLLNEADLKSHTEVISSTLDSGNVPVLIEKTSQVYTQLLNSTKDLVESDTSDHFSVQSVHRKDHTMSEHSAQTVTVDYSMPSTSEHIRQAESQSVPSTADYIQETKCWFSDITSDNLDIKTTSLGRHGDILTEETELGIMEHVGAIDDWEMLTEAPDLSTHQLRESTAVSWLNKVSCAPRGWESQKQTWCDDGLENGSDNEDFHALLDRRPVTNLLASSFRQRMDRMLLLHLQRHPEIIGDQDEIIVDHYAQVDSPSLQLPLPSELMRPWNHSQDQETSDDSGTYRSLQLRQPSSSGYPDSQHCSPFTNHQSLEMEMIYELKAHVERLQYEMTELRESIKSMGAEMKLDSVPKRKNCCICYSMQVDSLLYRCGHMCTCFKCAHELQWNNRNCPICRSPIVDVVRAYPDQ
ncbi:RING-type E3 ubiquitin transferase [Ranunculus cassubicifolius]